MFSKGQAILLLILLLIQTIQIAHCNKREDLKRALQDGDISLNFRLRQEHAKQENLISSRAITLKSQIGYQSADFYQNYLSLEAVNVFNFLGQHYNPGVDPLAKPKYSVIADPKGVGITNMSLVAEWIPDTDFIVGRQYISLDNQRMVGNNLFRQYPTSFDAITIKNDFFTNIKIFYSFINHINTFKNNSINVEGRRKLSTNLVNVTWTNFVYGQITAYGYSNNDRDISNNSYNTVGLRSVADDEFKRSYVYGYELEFAYQKSKISNPAKYRAWYLSASCNKDILELFNNWLLIGTLGYEFISGHEDGLSGRTFKFPLGSLYGFNGLAEGYTTIPDRGLVDYYVTSELKYLETFNLTSEVHLFRFAKGSKRSLAGFEVDVAMGFVVNKDLNMEIRLAKLNAKNKSTRSARRISGQINYLAL